MATNTPKTGLVRPALLDQHLITHFQTNADILDKIPGAFLCTSSTRPSTWGVNQTGRTIWETDTKLLWHWSGSAWERLLPKGKLGSGVRTSNLSTTSTTPVSLASAAVTIPAGGRSVMVTASWCAISNTNGFSLLWLYKDSASWIDGWGWQGDTSYSSLQDGIQGGSVSFLDTPAAGAVTYSFRMSTFGSGTSLATATADRPIQITIVEV